MMTVVRAILSVFSLTRRFSMILALSVMAAFSLPSLAQVELGTVLSHNGTTTSSPAGTGAVQVDLQYGPSVSGPYLGVFKENATHAVEVSYAPGSSTSCWARSVIANETTTAWSAVQILLQQADFAGWNPLTPTSAAAINPVTDIGSGAIDLNSVPLEQVVVQHAPSNAFVLAGSTVDRFNDTGSGFTDSLLTLTLIDPLAPDWSMVLWFSAIPSPGAAGSPEFTISYTPISVPEPGSLILLGLGTLSFAIRCQASRGSWWLENRRT